MDDTKAMTVSRSRVGGLDARGWRAATIAAPFAVQAVLALLFVALWALGKWVFPTHSPHGGERTWMLTATVVAALTSVSLSGALIRSPSPRRRGIALSLAASSAVVLIGGIVCAYVILR